uniref:DDE Tnp4 domain-containing protein n=1 Tax=Oryzias melastigma TaxID=30732 RepID=A0A3B3D4H0_ORYME
MEDVSRRKRMWVHPINRNRKQFGDFHHLVAELSLDRVRHLKYFRMSAEKMDHLQSLIGPDLTKRCTNYRESIQPKQRLAVTLRFLATGESFHSLAFQYRLGKSTVSTTVHTTCRAIERQMMDSQFPMPTEQMWRDSAAAFWSRCNFPNCIGAIDGQHINITAPPKSGSQFFNYKKTFSLVLLALVDANYCFISIQVGDYGRASDGGVYSGSDLGIGMENKTLHVPADCPLPGEDQGGPVPYAMVGDAAFPLKTYLMRPFPGQRLGRWQKVFNYRLSRARMVVECAFGILAARWRVLYTRITMAPENVDAVVMAVCILHNYLLNPVESQILLEEAEERGEHLQDARHMGANRGSRDAYSIREKFCAFFLSPTGSVFWQDRVL